MGLLCNERRMGWSRCSVIYVMACRCVCGGKECGGDRAEQDCGSPHARPPAVEPRHCHHMSLKDWRSGSAGDHTFSSFISLSSLVCGFDFFFINLPLRRPFFYHPLIYLLITPAAMALCNKFSFYGPFCKSFLVCATLLKNKPFKHVLEVLPLVILTINQMKREQKLIIQIIAPCLSQGELWHLKCHLLCSLWPF